MKGKKFQIEVALKVIKKEEENREFCSNFRLVNKHKVIDCPQKLDTIWGIFMERKVKYDYAFA
jgi:hypothetical protein